MKNKSSIQAQMRAFVQSIPLPKATQRALETVDPELTRAARKARELKKKKPKTVLPEKPPASLPKLPVRTAPFRFKGRRHGQA
jgi:hypothetical protein